MNEYQPTDTALPLGQGWHQTFNLQDNPTGRYDQDHPILQMMKLRLKEVRIIQRKLTKLGPNTQPSPPDLTLISVTLLKYLIVNRLIKWVNLQKQVPT